VHWCTLSAVLPVARHAPAAHGRHAAAVV
jgi:hypothetical protein